MTLLLVEGFDHFAFADKGLKGWTAGMQNMQAGRFGGQCLRGTNSSTSTFKYLAGSPTTLYTEAYTGFGLRLAGTPTIPYVSLRNSTTQTVRLTISGGMWRIENSSGVGFTSTVPANFGVWYFIEMYGLVAGASGAVGMWIEGVEAVPVQTLNIGTLGFTNWFINAAAGGSTANQVDIDDIYVTDTAGPAPQNGRLGVIRVETSRPTGAGNSTLWTPSAGANYAAVDDPTANADTDYVSSGTVGAVDTYAMSDLSVSTGSVLGVQHNLMARKDDAATRQLAPVTRIGSTDYVGATQPGLSSSYTMVSEMMPKDPTGADWTIASVNAAQFGMKVVV